MTYRYIYKITCTAGSFKGKFYYGQHTTENLDDGYKGSGSLLLKYYKKYPNDFNKEILLFCESNEELDEQEYQIIHNWLGNPLCLNLVEGGFRGDRNYSHSDETKKKIGEKSKNKIPWNKGKKGVQVAWNKGKKYSEETKRKIGAASKGRVHSEETRKKISESIKKAFTPEVRKKMSESRKGRISPNKGKHLLEETKKKMSEANKGKNKGNLPWNKGKKIGHLSEETKKKMSESLKGRISPIKGKKYNWISKNDEYKYIKAEELQKYLDAGWHIGRK